VAADVPVLLIGCQSEHLMLRPLRRAFPERTDEWDGNALVVDVTVQVGAFSARIEASFMWAQEFERFRDQFVALHRSLKGEAEFANIDGWVSIRVVGDGLGHLTARCKVTDQPGTGSSLAFELAFDQTEMPPMIEALDAIVRAFPVIGRGNRRRA
jgi:hypothetical protein